MAVPTFGRDPNQPPRTRRGLEFLSKMITSLMARGQITDIGNAKNPSYAIQSSLSPGGGLTYDGAGNLTIKLNTNILNLSTSGLGFSNQTGNVVLASPANGSNGPPTFRPLTSNDVPGRSINGILGNLTLLAGGNVTVTSNVTNSNIVISATVPPSPPPPPSVTGLNTLTGNVTIFGSANISVVSNVANSNITIFGNTSPGGGGTFACLPPPSAGIRLYRYLDEPYLSVSDGSTWFNYYVGAAPMTTPSAATFTTAINADANLTMTQKNGRVEFYSPLDISSGAYRRGFVHAQAGNFTVTCATELIRFIKDGGTAAIGLVVRKSSNAHMIVFERYQTADNHRVNLEMWSDESTFTGGIADGNLMGGVWPNPIYWQRIQHDGTNLIFSFSFDGFTWIPYYTYTYDSFISGFDQIGIVIANNGSNGPMWGNLWDYVVGPYP